MLDGCNLVLSENLNVLSNKLLISLSVIALKEKDIVATPTQPQLNSKVGCDMKMTLIHYHHHPPPPPTTQTQCQQYLSCYWFDFNQTLKLGSWDEQQQQQ